jgi:hypothetical protein
MKALAWDGKSPPTERFFRIAGIVSPPGCMPLFLVLSFVNEKHT